MAESRRVQLTSLSWDAAPSSVEPAAAHKSAPGAEQVKGNGPDRPADTETVRLVLTLFDSDERSFPEFSYSQLVDNKVGLNLLRVTESSPVNHLLDVTCLFTSHQYYDWFEMKDEIKVICMFWPCGDSSKKQSY